MYILHICIRHIELGYQGYTILCTRTLLLYFYQFEGTVHWPLVSVCNASDAFPMQHCCQKEPIRISICRPLRDSPYVHNYTHFLHGINYFVSMCTVQFSTVQWLLQRHFLKGQNVFAQKLCHISCEQY